MAIETLQIEIGAPPHGNAARSGSLLELRLRTALVWGPVAPARPTMHGVLTAWRAAERALGELGEGSPEWMAIHAAILDLRASYRARFDEYIADDGPS